MAGLADFCLGIQVPASNSSNQSSPKEDESDLSSETSSVWVDLWMDASQPQPSRDEVALARRLTM